MFELSDKFVVDSRASARSAIHNDISSGLLALHGSLVNVNDSEVALVQQMGPRAHALASNILEQDSSSVDAGYEGYPETCLTYRTEVEVAGVDEYFGLCDFRCPCHPWVLTVL